MVPWAYDQRMTNRGDEYRAAYAVGNGGSNRTAGVVIAVIGGIAAIAGVVMGFVPVAVIDETCGSVFSPTTYGASSVASAFVDNLCGGKISGQAIWTWTLIVGGIAMVIFGVVRAMRAPHARD